MSIASVATPPVAPLDRETRGVAGGAERHGFEQTEPRRHGDDPVGRNAAILGVTTVVSNAHVIARADHFVAGFEARIA
jgi:hypothetical protein